MHLGARENDGGGGDGGGEYYSAEDLCVRWVSSSSWEAAKGFLYRREAAFVAFEVDPQSVEFFACVASQCVGFYCASCC